MTNKQNIPHGFKPSPRGPIPSDWVLKPLGELGFFSKGKGILKEQVIESGLPCIRYGEIYTTHDFIVKEFKSYISEDVAKESNEIKKGDILFAGSGETLEEIGKAVAYIGNEKAYAGGDVIILSTNEKVNTECLSYSLEIDFVKRQKRRLGQGHSVVHIYPSDLSTLKIPLPPLPEQRAIAHILGLMDTAINKNNLLIAKKELQKKWLMQNLLTGKKRMKGFGGEWKESKLGDFGKLKMCKRVFNHETGNKGEIPFYKIGTFGKKADAFISKELYDEYRTKFSFPQKGEILISAAGTLGRTVVYDGSPGYFQDSNIVWISHNESKVTNEYLFYAYGIISFDSEGGTIQRLYNNIIKNARLNLPPLEEQTAIAQVLQAADKEIQLLKTKTEKLREQKKGLMQVLLTGKKRLTVKAENLQPQ